MALTNKEKQKAFVNRKKEKGLVRVVFWVSTEKKEWLKKFIGEMK
jgi:hypothetical protein